MAHKKANRVTKRGASAPASRSPAKGAEPDVADDVLARADAVIDQLGREYPFHASRDLAAIAQTAQMMTADAQDSEPYYGELMRLAHDLSGQGAVFGYPMITRLGRSLCMALRSLDPRDRDFMTIVDCHIDGMRALLDQGVTGADDRGALAIAAGLELLVHSRTDG